VELSKLGVPLDQGPMYRFVNALAELQRSTSILNPPFRMALVTARNFQYMQRPIETLRSWGIRLDKAYLIGDMKKKDVLRDLKAVMFFDDSPKHCADAAEYVPTALILKPAVVAEVRETVLVHSDWGGRKDIFGGLCKLVLRKDYSKHADSLMLMYQARIIELSDNDFGAKMEELERSATGTPRGKLVKERQAAGSENTEFQKLKSFLDDLLDSRTGRSQEA